MPRISSSARRILITVMAAVLVATVMLAVYAGSMPQTYSLNAGDTSPFDITAPRSIRDRAETDLRAAKAAAEVTDVMLRSDTITAQVKANVATFFSIIDDLRRGQPAPSPTAGETTPSETSPPAEPAAVAEAIIIALNDRLGIVVQQTDALAYATLEDDRYASIKGHVNSLTSLIMAMTVDSASLRNAVSEKIVELENSLDYYKEDSGIIERTLAALLEPNVVYDQVATENARQAAYDRIQSNPVMIEKGSRIVSMGDIITDETYTLLKDLALIDGGGFDTLLFAGIALLLILLMGVAVFYIRLYEKETIRTVSDIAALALALVIPLLVSVYTARAVPLSPPVYFAAVLITSYFGFRAAVILSLCLSAAILPMTNFNPVFLMVAMIGCLVAALFTRGIIRKGNYAFIIITTGAANFLITLSYGLLQKETWADLSLNCGYASLSGVLSVIAAIGIMPLFEMLFNSVSPMRLIELSQPGYPLLRRLFVEAPGSSQHSMMVANLADAASSAIGANALLARVGAYYHDIGKLENPLMFTENQEGENPHDFLSPEQSAEMILNHPDAGVRIGRRYHLPSPILRIIHEHHGSTAQAYFYHKAVKGAEEGSRPEPDLSNFKYRCPIPSTPESAIVMLADSVEAAMKSTGTNRLEEAEKLIRKIIKTKNDQDQLIASGLSYRDVETLIQAFLQVYTGHFHERVKYPDDRPIRQPAE
jgi:cyclic-di-AMP phosphodiesterase PgpH